MALAHWIRVVLGGGCAMIIIGVVMAFGAAVAGRIEIASAVAAVKPLPVFKNRNFCGRQVVNETLIIGRDG